MKTPSTTMPEQPLHSVHPLPRRHFNRVFAAVYTMALLCHFYHHILTLLHSTSTVSFFISFLLFISDIILAFMWSTSQAFRMNPVHRREYPENLHKYLEWKDFPTMDIFICTADPYKEPPINVVNTALSVLAYDYPAEKLSVYVSDDGGSELTLFAFMEAAKFGKVWLPFCRENDIIDRCPDAYFSSNYDLTANHSEIKLAYDSMKMKVENSVEKGQIRDEYISNDRHIFNQFRVKKFTRQNHPSIIQVLLNSKKDEDISGQLMPNLTYVSREKNTAFPHHFKAGALNTLLRVSGIMTNAPIVLTLDCDMYSNDPSTLARVLCYFSVKSSIPNYGYIQFPQRYHGLNKTDIYSCEHKRLFRVNPVGMDGLAGPNYVGTGCFFSRRVFFGGPKLFITPETQELSPTSRVEKPINSEEIMKLAMHVSGCNYENKTNWGSKMGFRYGSLVEDYFTGYRLTCEGWQSVFCDPKRPAFLGDVPITLNDVLSQTKRWAVGLLEVAFSKYCPLTYGTKSMGILMAQCYAHYSLWPIWSIPVAIYACTPSLAFVNGVTIFPMEHQSWCFIYVFLFLGAYAQDCLEFMMTEGTFSRWWNDQRMWLIRGLSCHLFGSIEFITKTLGIASHGFSLTSKVMDNEQSKRYEQGIFEFGVASPLFVPLVTATMLNLAAFAFGVLHFFIERSIKGFFIQILIASFGVLNSYPVYEAIALRSDRGKIPKKTIVHSTIIVGAMYAIAYVTLRV